MYMRVSVRAFHLPCRICSFLLIVEARGSQSWAVYSMKLLSDPVENVTVTATCAEAVGTQFAITPSTLRFTSGNWNASQVVNVSAIDDRIDEGTYPRYTITHVVSSAAVAYDGITVVSIAVVLTEASTAGVTVTPADDSVLKRNRGSPSKVAP